ncbi:MAG: DNA internalization-related competence protein ComEC/Rec2 [Nitrospira sp.]|jgi:competence protein ComEC|nr:DNA internalization-related competence protein ComEC/Rec2 [Nitrospira sp.]
MLPALTAAFFFGLLCGAQLSFFPLSIIALLVGIAVGFGILERAGSIDSPSALLLYAGLLSGVVYWSLTVPMSGSPQMSPPLHETIQSSVVGRVVAPVQHSVGRQTILVQTDESDSEPRHIRLVWRDPGLTLHHGDRISFQGKLHRPRGALNPGGFDYAAYMERQGVDLLTTVIGAQAVTLLEAEPQIGLWSVWNRIDHWRDRIRAAAVKTLSQPTRGLFLGMIIGERGYLEQHLQDWFMVTGTVHLLSISGSHLGLVALVVFWLVKRLVLRLPSMLLLTLSRTVTPSKIAILLAWPAVALYALLAGAELATMRSLVMITLAMIAMWLGYERHLGHAMAVALLVILLHDPRAIFDISFQLSFLSVLVMVRMIVFTKSWNADVAETGSRLRDRFMSHALNALAMSGAVTVATLPMVAFYFNQVPWMGTVTNLIVVPFTGVILVPLGLFAALWTIMTGAESLILGSAMEQLFGLMVLGLQWCASLPGGEWHVAAPSIPAIALFYAGLLLTSFQVIPWRVRAAGAGLSVLLIGWWLSPPVSQADGDHWRVTFLDVGQGDSAVVELPDGQTVLIDGGSRYERFDMGKNVIAPFLWSRRIHHLSHVIGTHQQLDHVGGLIWVLRHMSVGRYWSGGIERAEKFAEDLKTALRDRHIDQHTAVRGQDLLQSGRCRLNILNPPDTPVIRASTQPHSGTILNNLSIVSRLQCGTYSILFAADIETGGVRRLNEEGYQPVTVLKVPHHGARSSLDPDWLRQLQPQYAVISVGAANPYGHPTEAVLETYQDQHIPVFRTDRDGAIWVTGRLSTSEFTVSRMRDLIVRPVDFPHCLWRCESQNWHRLFLQFS